MTHLEKRLQNRFRDLPTQLAPGFQLLVAHRGQKVADVSWGKTWLYYDLASLTKIIFTTTQWMRMVSEQACSLDEKITTYLKWYPHPQTARQLLCHSAGNEWWWPFYKDLSLCNNIDEKKITLKRLIRDMPITKGKTSVYSDIDFFLLGFLLEDMREQSLSGQWKHFVEQQLPQNKMHFNENNTPVFKRSDYAPTEKCTTRKKTLQGEVHDENTWYLGGVSSHAGLFGRAEDVLNWGLWLRQVWQGKSDYIGKSTAREFFHRAIPRSSGDWALGFMLPTEGHASCGQYFSLESVGHTGFTGTSFWWDMPKDIMVVLLSNRVYPTRSNEVFRKERPKIHDAVVEELTRIL